MRIHTSSTRRRNTSTRRRRFRTPDIPDDIEAFWRRWLLVEFPNHYSPSERDPDLRARLTEPDRLSGVLNWAIAGRARLLEQGHFTNEDTHEQGKRERWQAWGESVDTFIAECVDRDEESPRLSTQDAHRRYAAWCRENGLDPVGQREFTNTLKNEDVEYGRHHINGSVKRGYKALGLSTAFPTSTTRRTGRTTPRPTRTRATTASRVYSNHGLTRGGRRIDPPFVLDRDGRVLTPPYTLAQPPYTQRGVLSADLDQVRRLCTL
jgi:Predicted ATPase